MKINVKDIIPRLKEYFKVKSDEKLASILDVSIHTIRAWKQRNSVDFRIIIEKCDDSDLNWIFYGKNDNTNCSVNTDTDYISILKRLSECENENIRLKITIEALQDRLLSLRNFQSMPDMPKKFKPELS